MTSLCVCLVKSLFTETKFTEKPDVPVFHQHLNATCIGSWKLYEQMKPDHARIQQSVRTYRRMSQIFLEIFLNGKLLKVLHCSCRYCFLLYIFVFSAHRSSQTVNQQKTSLSNESPCSSPSWPYPTDSRSCWKTCLQIVFIIEYVPALFRNV